MMVVGWSDFAMGFTHTRRGDKEPDGIAEGLRVTQRNKVSIFNAVRLPFCAARLIWRHKECLRMCQPLQCGCAVASVLALSDCQASPPLTGWVETLACRSGARHPRPSSP